MSEIRICKKCGFILGMRPNNKDSHDECKACLNYEKRATIDFTERQRWLTNYIKEKKGNFKKWDCVIGVSGGKDSTAIVRQLMENHGIKNPLLICVTDEFTHTEAGKHNLHNISAKFNLDLITLRCQPQKFIAETRKDFLNFLHPLKWIEEQLYQMPLQIAKDFGINLVFYGENPDFEYGSSETLDIFHPATDDKTSLIYMGAIYPYYNFGVLEQAKEVGFKALGEFDEWYRQGSIEDFAQIDSVGYMVHHWCKFIKFGFQRVSDMAGRFVREGKLTRQQAEEFIKERDYILDPRAKYDFCKTLSISENEFNNTIDKFANRELLVKDANGFWRRKDLYKADLLQ